VTFDQLGNRQTAYIAAGLARRHASMSMIGWLHANPTEASKACQVFPYIRPYVSLLSDIFVPKIIPGALGNYPENLEAIALPVPEL